MSIGAALSWPLTVDTCSHPSISDEVVKYFVALRCFAFRTVCSEPRYEFVGGDLVVFARHPVHCSDFLYSGKTCGC